MAFNEESVAAEQAVEQKLAEAGANEVRRHTFSEAPETVAAPEPVVEEQPRDEAGRFASKQEEEAAAATEETQPVEEIAADVAAETSTEDPALAAFLAKYDGDVDKALQAAAHLSKKIGERDEKAKGYDEVRGELEQIKEQLATQEAARQNQPQPVPDQATIDWVDEQIAMNPAVAPQYAVQALQAGQTLLYQRVMRQWHDHDSYAATEFSNAVRFEQLKSDLQAAQPVAAPSDQAEMQTALTTVLTSNPEFNQYADDLGAVIERYPAAAAGLRGTQQEKQQAIETLFALAERDTLRAIALSGTTPTEPASSQEVATSTTSTEHQLEEPAAPSKLDTFREEFRKTAEEMRGGAFVAR